MRVRRVSQISRYLSLLAFSLVVCCARAQSPENFRLDGGNTTYVFGVNERSELQSLYWGGRLGAHDSVPPAHSFPEMASFDSPYTTTPEEYAGWGAGLFVEPALKVTFADGNRDLVLHLRQPHCARGWPRRGLKDISRKVFVTLHYSMDAAERNPCAFGDHRKSRVAARHYRNRQPRPHGPCRRPGTRSITSPAAGRASGRCNQEPLRHGARGDREPPRLHRAPGQSVVRHPGRRGDRREARRSVVWRAWHGADHGALPSNRTSSMPCASPADSTHSTSATCCTRRSRWRHRCFTAAIQVTAWAALRAFCIRFEITNILPHRPGQQDPPKPRPVIYNSWEATEFRVSEAGQIALAEKAGALGIDRFVMDDGWFGQRKDDHAGLGDWYVNKEKFPNGLKPLIDKVHSLGWTSACGSSPKW